MFRRAASAVVSVTSRASQYKSFSTAAVDRSQIFRRTPATPSSFRTNSVLASPPRTWEPSSVSRAASGAFGRRPASSRTSCLRELPALAATRHFATAVSTERGMGTVASASKSSGGKGREFPDNVRVGVGVVILRAGPPSADDEPEIEVLMARRAKPPDLGMWSFPGGGQRLGETLVECARRETMEETGLTLGGILEPTVLTAVDCINVEESTGRIQFHYTIIEVVSSLAADTMREKAASDVSELTWLTPGQIADLEGKGQVSHGCADVAFEARRQYGDVMNSRDESTSAMRSC